MKRSLLFAWIALLALLAVEVALTWLRVGWAAGFIVPVMLGIVAVVFMRVLRESQLSRVFALAGLFWLAVLIGLGGVDFLTRHDYPTPYLTEH